LNKIYIHLKIVKMYAGTKGADKILEMREAKGDLELRPKPCATQTLNMVGKCTPCAGNT
jgi:hypothetical protein